MASSSTDLLLRPLLLLLLPTGTRYASGAVLRVLRSYPGSWTAHVVSSDGASQVRSSALRCCALLQVACLEAGYLSTSS
jgi:hypothetical protein